MKAIAPFTAFLLTSCATVQPAPDGPSAAIGEKAYTNGLHVRPTEVLEDSRCPADVVCVWAGRLIVRSEVGGGTARRTLDLQLGQPQHVADGALTLVAAIPGKAAGTNIDPRAYRFTFDFQGGL